MGVAPQLAPSIFHSSALPSFASTFTGGSPTLNAFSARSPNTAFIGSERRIVQFHASSVVTCHVGASSGPPTRCQFSFGWKAISSGPSSTAAD